MLFVSRELNADISDASDDDDDDDKSCTGRYDRKQNTRDADDLRQCLRQRLNTSLSVFSLFCCQLQDHDVNSK